MFQFGKTSEEYHAAAIAPLEALHKEIVAKMPNTSSKPHEVAPVGSRHGVIDLTFFAKSATISPKWYQERQKKRLRAAQNAAKNTQVK